MSSGMATGARGRDLLNGAKFIKIHGQDITVNAEVDIADGFSALADQEEIINWIKNLSTPPKLTFITHKGPLHTSVMNSPTVAKNTV